MAVEEENGAGNLAAVDCRNRDRAEALGYLAG